MTTIILRVYRHAKLVAECDDTGVIHVLTDSLGKPYVELPYISPACVPQYADPNQTPCKWGHTPEEE